MTEAVALSSLDSERFGITVARAPEVTADAVGSILQYCERHGVELLIARCAGADHATARALTGAGLFQLEAQITYRGQLRPGPGPPSVRVAVADDTDAVLELARLGFSDYAGHYHADPRLPREACRDVYVDWTRRGISGEASDAMYVAELDGRLCGFGFFTRESDHEIQYQLATVAPWARGRGLYSAILAHGMSWGLDQGADAVLGIVAHGTISAHRNLLAAGLLPVSATSTFHGWYSRRSRGGPPGAEA
jgi:hypothetical protein